MSDTHYDPRPDERTPPRSGWRWKTIDIVALLILLVVFWPLGLAFLVWKIWNDKKPVPTDLEDLLRTAGGRLDAQVQRWSGDFDSWRTTDRTSGLGARTGNAAFDAYVERREAEIAAQRRSLEEEIAEFRRYAAEARGDADLYERFKSRRNSDADQPPPRA